MYFTTFDIRIKIRQACDIIILLETRFILNAYVDI
jgi:hypothetical protein